MSAPHKRKKISCEVSHDYVDTESECSEDSFAEDDDCYGIPFEPQRKKEIIQNWILLAPIQAGGFSRTYKCQWRRKRTNKYAKESKIHCIKIYNNEMEKVSNHEQNVASKLKEAKHLISLSPQKTFNDSASGLSFAYTTMPLFQSDLVDFQEKHELTDSMIYDIVTQVCTGLQELHSKQIVHCDMKSENILINFDEKSNSIHVNICDYGSAFFMNSKFPKLFEDAGHTLQLSPPELICETIPLITGKTDVFPIGCLLVQLFLEFDLFDVQDDQYLIMLALIDKQSTSKFPPEVKQNKDFFTSRNILKNGAQRDVAGTAKWYVPYNNVISQQLIDLVNRCIEADQSQRIGLQELKTSIQNLQALNTWGSTQTK